VKFRTKLNGTVYVNSTFDWYSTYNVKYRHNIYLHCQLILNLGFVLGSCILFSHCIYSGANSCIS